MPAPDCENSCKIKGLKGEELTKCLANCSSSCNKTFCRDK